VLDDDDREAERAGEGGDDLGERRGSARRHGDHHVEFDDTGSIVLGDGPLVNGCRPAADVTMTSAARVYGRRAIGVVMTGMGKDGTAGALAIKQADGKTIAQDQATSVIYGMPKAAIDAGAIDEVVGLGEIASWLRRA